MRPDLLAERVELIADLGKPLIDPPETLLILRKTPIEALEPFENFPAYLFEPQHRDAPFCEARASEARYRTPVVKTVRERYVSPGRSVVVGKLGLFGESGKCCVSRQKP